MHDWVGRVIYWKQSKRLNVDRIARWYKHKPESLRENENVKILRFWDPVGAPNPDQIES